jgi:glycosyltransferase involved in cell wall biosynthesis
MRISIDASGLGVAKTGTAVYLEEILKSWSRNPSFQDEVTVHATDYGARHLESLRGAGRFVFRPAPSNRLARIAWQQTVLPRRIDCGKFDIHWGAGFVVPFFSSVPAVVTVFDLTFQLFPEVHEPVKRLYFPLVIRASVSKARRILAISESAARDLWRFHPGTRNKTVVTLLAPRKFEACRSLRPDSDGVPNPRLRFLFVGTLEPRKNLKRLLEAWRGIPEPLRAKAQLRIAGAMGWMVRDVVRDVVRNADAEKDVAALGALSDAELAAEYREADAFVYPSIYEGFGLPVLEAMALGVPVLTSDSGATREVAGDAALLVDPYSVGSLRAALMRLIVEQPLRVRLAEKGLARSKDFSWDLAAEKTLATLHAAAMNPDNHIFFKSRNP